MAATALQIGEVRRMCALEVDDATYTDEVLTQYIEEYPLIDERGEEPYTFDSSTTPPSQDANEEWIPTYDLHAAAAKVWSEVAAAAYVKFDVSADGANLQRSQVYQQAMSQVYYHNSRRAAKSMTFVKWPKETDVDQFPWIGNLREPDD